MQKRMQEQHETNCQANYKVVSGGMEVAGVLDMFRQSKPSRRVRYRYYLGNGDCAAFPAVLTENSYGPDYPIEKLECRPCKEKDGYSARTLKLKIGMNALSHGKK